MKDDGSVVLFTGANGGIGRAFVQALLAHGAAKIDLGALSQGAAQAFRTDPVGMQGLVHAIA